MTPDMAKVKCHKFLSTLQTAVSQRKSDAVVENVRELIQVRIGGRTMKEQVKNNLLICQELVNDRI